MHYNLLEVFGLEKYAPIIDWGKRGNTVTYSHVRQTGGTDPKWWVGTAKLANNPIGRHFKNNMNASAGTSIYIKETLLRTIGETIERYSSTNSHLVDTPVMLPVDATKGYVRCHSQEPSPPSYKSVTTPVPIEHTQVIRLADNSVDYLPSEHMHLGFMQYRNRPMHTSPISTGCAFFPDQVTAIWKGICEVVERDAMMRAWHTRQQCTRIDLNSIIDFDITERLHRIKDQGLALQVFEISSIVSIPVMYAILIGEEFPYYCVGASADASPERAIIKAVDEVVSIRTMANWNGFRRQGERDYELFDWVNSLDKHMELYANWRDTPAFDFLLRQTAPAVTLPELRQQKAWLQEPHSYAELQGIGQDLAAQGYDVYWKDVSIPDVKEFGYVTKVTVPQMIPLSQAFSCRWLSPLFDDDTIATVNPYPHPFS
ncbi:YcaO-like family protein [Hymenobacter sp. GOD-10R]|uniref:YcaO-like family protein n=1 Tax=Hymenobacter sp. GOD-10R TaxID=3093922 RepID=UPI002D76989A|nr:YcaO-like family protein [Hymenobacter sp. GOD-10R]WRQ31755.1 YcaO-like family protein [Hymenobacter sp. GOD-10R]